MSNEELDKWLRDNVWNARSDGSKSKQLYIMREGRMVSCGWWLANKMWKYRRGKSGRIIRRPSKHYDDCMRMINMFRSIGERQ